MMRMRKNVRGFTLMEMIVATAIFATASVIIADLFLISNRAQRRAESSQAVQSDARVLLSQIIERVRSGEIDYDAYGAAISKPTDALAITDERGRSVIIRASDTDFNNTVCPSQASTPCLEISEDGGTTFQPMTSKRIRLVGVQFYVDPPESPLTEVGGVYTYDVQPRVTVVLGLQGSVGSAAELGTKFVQSTISSRVLLR